MHILDISVFLSLPVFNSSDSHSLEFKISIRLVMIPWNLDDYITFLQFSNTSRSNEFDAFLKYMLYEKVEWYGSTGLGTTFSNPWTGFCKCVTSLPVQAEHLPHLYLVPVCYINQANFS